MKLRYKILYMSFGAMLVVLGMVLNSLVSGDAEAQEGVPYETKFNFVSCKGIVIKDENGRQRGYFGLSSTYDAKFEIYGDDGKTSVAYLGGNAKENDEMMFYLKSKSKTDKRQVSMEIDGNGGRFDSSNKMGEDVVRLGVGNDGGGVVDKRDKFGYEK